MSELFLKNATNTNCSVGPFHCNSMDIVRYLTENLR